MRVRCVMAGAIARKSRHVYSQTVPARHLHARPSSRPAFAGAASSRLAFAGRRRPAWIPGQGSCDKDHGAQSAGGAGFGCVTSSGVGRHARHGRAVPGGLRPLQRGDLTVAGGRSWRRDRACRAGLAARRATRCCRFSRRCGWSMVSAIAGFTVPGSIPWRSPSPRSSSCRRCFWRARRCDARVCGLARAATGWRWRGWSWRSLRWRSTRFRGSWPGSAGRRFPPSASPPARPRSTRSGCC